MTSLRQIVLCTCLLAAHAFMPPAVPNATPNPSNNRADPTQVSRPTLVAPADIARRQTAEGPIAAAGADGATGDSAHDPELTLKAMQKFAEKYCEITDTFFCSDLEIAATVVKGLAKHKDELGAPLCPCRHYEDKAAEVSMAYWNCPCVPMRERKECHCMLFLTPDNAFAGKEQKLPDGILQEGGVAGLS